MFKSKYIEKLEKEIAELKDSLEIVSTGMAVLEFQRDYPNGFKIEGYCESKNEGLNKLYNVANKLSTKTGGARVIYIVNNKFHCLELPKELGIYKLTKKNIIEFYNNDDKLEARYKVNAKYNTLVELLVPKEKKTGETRPVGRPRKESK